MNASIEHAFAAWLTAAGITAAIHTGASAEEFDPENLTVIVSVPDVEHSVGPLHRATVNLVVSGPAYHAQRCPGSHEISASIRQAAASHSPRVKSISRGSAAPSEYLKFLKNPLLAPLWA
ncbi:MAG: hypothetical protein KGS60_19580 [Verrucomicrobia bacterium]|nr:hypothetical protein [Verrucomicrobiota bacterium]